MALAFSPGCHCHAAPEDFPVKPFSAFLGLASWTSMPVSELILCGMADFKCCRKEK